LTFFAGGRRSFQGSSVLQALAAFRRSARATPILRKKKKGLREGLRAAGNIRVKEVGLEEVFLRPETMLWGGERFLWDGNSLVAHRTSEQGRRKPSTSRQSFIPDGGETCRENWGIQSTWTRKGEVPGAQKTEPPEGKKGVAGHFIKGHKKKKKNKI